MGTVPAELSPAAVRVADLSSADAERVAALALAYLTHTEREKAEHLGSDVDDALPERYRAEIDDPRRAYSGATCLIAEVDGHAVGLAIVHPIEGARELKRMWVDPSARGLGIGAGLLAAALGTRESATRLTVWDWRDGAIRLYRRFGFSEVASWESRERLVCMEAPAAP